MIIESPLSLSTPHRAIFEAYRLPMIIEPPLEQNTPRASPEAYGFLKETPFNRDSTSFFGDLKQNTQFVRHFLLRF